MCRKPTSSDSQGMGMAGWAAGYGGGEAEDGNELGFPPRQMAGYLMLPTGKERTTHYPAFCEDTSSLPYKQGQPFSVHTMPAQTCGRSPRSRKSYSL